MTENKNVEVNTEETTEIVAVEEKKDGFVKKVGTVIKENGPKVLKAISIGTLGLIGGYLLATHTAGKSDDSDIDDCDVIDIDDYTVEEDAE